VAERIRTRLLSQVDERRSPRTRATVGQLLDRWLGVLDVDPSTRRTYEGYIRKHIRPLLGSLSLSQTAAWTCSTKWAPVLPGSGSSTTRTGTGQPEGVSEAVLEAMATALQLDQSECGHVRRGEGHVCSGHAPASADPSDPKAPANHQRLPDSMSASPLSYATAGSTSSAQRVKPGPHSLPFQQPRRPANLTRFVSLRPVATRCTRTGRNRPVRRPAGATLSATRSTTPPIGSGGFQRGPAQEQTRGVSVAVGGHRVVDGAGDGGVHGLVQ
jgi:hypothetical protein